MASLFRRTTLPDSNNAKRGKRAKTAPSRQRRALALPSGMSYKKRKTLHLGRTCVRAFNGRGVAQEGARPGQLPGTSQSRRGTKELHEPPRRALTPVQAPLTFRLGAVATTVARPAVAPVVAAVQAAAGRPFLEEFPANWTFITSHLKTGSVRGRREGGRRGAR